MKHHRWYKSWEKPVAEANTQKYFSEHEKIKGNKKILLIHEIVVDNQKHVTATE